MHSYYHAHIDSIKGNDDFVEDNSQILRSLPHVYKTLESAMEVLSTGCRVFMFPGNYSGLDIVSDAGPFEYTVVGSGPSVAIKIIRHTGLIFSTYRDVHINEVKYECSGITSLYDHVIFGSYPMSCRPTEIIRESIVNTIEFNKCVFGSNFQIMIYGGSTILCSKIVVL